MTLHPIQLKADAVLDLAASARGGAGGGRPRRHCAQDWNPARGRLRRAGDVADGFGEIGGALHGPFNQ